MVNKLIKDAFLSLLFISPALCMAGSNLQTLCNSIDGTLYTRNYINNINVNDQAAYAGVKSLILGLHYKGQWYSATGIVATSILNSAVMAVLLHHKVDMCVDNTTGSEKVMGIEFS